MRLSASLALILAAITVSNAAVVDSALRPNHHLAAVKNGNARVNAIDTANAKVNHVDIKNLKHLVQVAARRGLDVAALGAAQTNVDTVDLKHVAGMVHTLSASLESQSTEADQIKGTNLNAVKVHSFLSQVKTTFASSIADIHGLTSGATEKNTDAKVAVLRRDGLLSTVDLDSVTDLIATKNIAGTQGLTSMLDGLKLDSVLQGDVLSMLSNTHVLTAVHDVADAGQILSSVTAIPDAIPLMEAIQRLDDPACFVDSLADIQSLDGLVAAAPGGVGSISKLEGAAKMVAYITKFGSGTTSRIFAVGGVTTVLASVQKVPGSVKVLESLKTVTDVPAFVSGLHAIPDVTTFVTSIQAVNDLVSLNSVLSTVNGVAPVAQKRELLDSVTGITEGLDVTRVLALKRAIAHVVALPNNKLVLVDEKVQKIKRSAGLVDGVNDTVGGLNVAQVAVLKRSVADLSVLSEKEIEDIRAAMKRDVLSGLNLAGANGLTNTNIVQSQNGLLEGLNLDHIAQLKRDVLSGLNLGDATDLKNVDILQHQDALLSGVNLDHIAQLKRDLNLQHVTGLGRVGTVNAVDSQKNLLEGFNLGSVHPLKRDVLSGLDLAGAKNLDATNIVSSQNGLLEGLNVDHLAQLKRDVLSGLNLGDATDLKNVKILQSQNGLLEGLNLDHIASLKREILSGLPLGGVTSAVGSPLSLVDLNRLTALKRSMLLSPVEGTVSSLNLLSVVPAVKRTIANADVNFLTQGNPRLAHVNASRRNVANTDANVDTILLADSIDTLTVDVQNLMGKVVSMADALHTDSITSDVKEQVVPMVHTLAFVLGNVVSQKAPHLNSKVDKVNQIADKVDAVLN